MLIALLLCYGCALGLGMPALHRQQHLPPLASSPYRAWQVLALTCLLGAGYWLEQAGYKHAWLWLVCLLMLAGLLRGLFPARPGQLLGAWLLAWLLAGSLHGLDLSQ